MSGSTMHVSGFFDRLRLVADLDYSDTEQDQAYEAALARIDDDAVVRLILACTSR